MTVSEFTKQNQNVPGYAEALFSRCAGDNFDALAATVNLVLKGFPSISFAGIFGSAAKGRLTDHSDVDIAVAALLPLSLERRADLLTALSRALDREIDVIDLQAVTGLILQQALCTGKIIKKTDTRVYAGLLKRMLFNQADMMPYYRRILEHRNRAWLQQ